MTQTVTVKYSLLEQAWAQWLDVHFGLDCEECMDRFCEFVDPGDKNVQVLDYWGGNKGTYEVSLEIADRLRALTGPHHHTIIKAYYVKHPWK